MDRFAVEAGGDFRGDRCAGAVGDRRLPGDIHPRAGAGFGAGVRERSGYLRVGEPFAERLAAGEALASKSVLNRSASVTIQGPSSDALLKRTFWATRPFLPHNEVSPLSSE